MRLNITGQDTHGVTTWSFSPTLSAALCTVARVADAPFFAIVVPVFAALIVKFANDENTLCTVPIVLPWPPCPLLLCDDAMFPPFLPLAVLFCAAVCRRVVCLRRRAAAGGACCFSLVYGPPIIFKTSVVSSEPC